MQEKKNHPVIVAMLWICFLAAISLVAYLSFQNGEDAKEVGKSAIQLIAQQNSSGNGVSQQDIDTLTYIIRQAGRTGAFFVIGILGTLAVYVSFKKWNWFLKGGITAAVLIGFAYLTEKLKIFIPSRHYNYDEMMLSIIAVIAGFALVTVITLIFCAMKRISRLLAAALNP
ncbi:MAG: VanZ family protein [Lachnospiraceae bacterium]|nr:VanZ family protein [Lachnospiraceae bacterium]